MKITKVETIYTFQQFTLEENINERATELGMYVSLIPVYEKDIAVVVFAKDVSESVVENIFVRSTDEKTIEDAINNRAKELNMRVHQIVAADGYYKTARVVFIRD